MAYQMIHMEVAYRLLERWTWIAHPAEFIVGAVAPDSVHMSENFQIERKVKSHLFEACGPWGDTQDYEQWLTNIRSFWLTKGYPCNEPKEKAFIAGICVHCLTDYCNDRNIWRKLQNQHIPPMTLEAFREAYYPEARGIDQWLFQNSPNTSQIVKLFEKGEGYCVQDLLCVEEIQKQKEHMLHTQYCVDTVDISKYQFLSADFIEHFIVETVSKIAHWLE